MSKTQQSILASFFLLFTLWISVSAEQQQPYDSDQQTSNISELWRWNELTPLALREIHCGDEDSQQQLWFATTGELLLYNGYEVIRKPFPDEFKDSRTIDLHISQRDIIYAYTTDGLLRYQPNLEKWKILQTFKFNDFWNEEVIVESRTGTVFTITPFGLYKIDESNLIQLHSGQQGRLNLAISQDFLWLSAEQQIFQFHLKDGELFPGKKPLIHTPPNLRQNQPNYRIVASELNDVFIFTYSKELVPHKFDTKKQAFVATRLFKDFLPTNYWKALYIGTNKNDLLLLGHSLNLHRVQNTWQNLNIKSKRPMNNPYVIKRSNGNLIIGARWEKVYEVDCSDTRWKRFNELNFYCESKSGNYWFISYDGKVLEFDPKTAHWTHHAKNVIDAPLSIMESSDGYIWVSGSHDKTAAISYFDGLSWKLDLHPRLSTRIGHSSALELSNQDIIFGAGNETNDNGGVVIYQRKADSYDKISFFPPVVPKRIEVVKEGIDGIYFGGRYLYRWQIGSAYELVDVPTNDIRWIDTLESDPSGHIWVGTLPNYGMHKWDGEKWSTYTGEPFLSRGEVVYIANQSQTNDMWITCRNDILQYQTTTDSWIPKSFDSNLLFQRESGNLQFDKHGKLWINQSPRSWYFRGSSDYKITDELKANFNTTRFTPDTVPPIVKLTSLPETSTEPASVLIRWDGIDYYCKTPANELAYSYRINSDKWTEFTISDELVLNNLKSGDYQIQIRCRDLDGNVCSLPATANFTVLPMLWKQPWFIAMCVFVTLTIVSLIILTVYFRVHHVLEIERFKNQFFMNMSHELRTPLTVILGPLESLKQSKLSPKQFEKLELAHKNSQKMLSLVDQLLDFRRHIHGLKNRKYQHLDVISFIKEEIDSIRPIFEIKKQTIHVNCSPSKHQAWFESEKLEHIIENLLSNACKYTPEEGSITTKISINKTQKAQEVLIVSVEDDGMGIPKHLQKKVFDPFFRIQHPNDMKESGTGIGLAFVKELTDSMNGTISVESPVSSRKTGSKFTVRIPLPSAANFDQKNIHERKTSRNKTNDAIKENKDDKQKPLILLTEDDPDIRKFLKLELESTHEIIEADNGVDGLEKAKEHIPDIILSDVLMPKQNGFTFCENLKNTAETSHIPVIMLTALKADQHELKALQKGADDFISKPVSINILKQKVRNLLQLRHQMHRKFEIQKAQGKFDGAEITSIRSDEVFINKIVQIIEDSYQDPQFDVESIAGKMFMSRVTLYRKFKAITGESPSQFIKTVRMNKAATLLTSSDYTISEISDMVGYKEPGYFGTAFKSLFGDTPKKYREKKE